MHTWFCAMDDSLLKTVLEFSPHLINKSKKKVKIKPKENKLSLKNRNQQTADLPPPPRPPRRLTRRTAALIENNHNSRSSQRTNPITEASSKGRSPGKENQALTNSIKINSSDSDEEVENTVGNLISEEDSPTQSDARHSSSTYKTCHTSQQQPPDQEDEEVEVLQISFNNLSVLTPDKSGLTEEAVSSCEKVQWWLKRIPVSSTPATVNDAPRRRHVSESSDSSDDVPVSTSVYPTTTISSRSLPTESDSNYGTSRQSSSFLMSQQSNVASQKIASQFSPNSSPRRTTQRIVTEHSSNSAFKMPTRTTRTRESLFSSITEGSSQATTIDTRGSSQYFVDQPPWSKSVKKISQKTAQARVSSSSSELSDIREERTPKAVNKTSSTEESIHLAYSPTYSNINETSPDAQVSVSNRKQSNDEASLPDTLPWPGTCSTRSSIQDHNTPYIPICPRLINTSENNARHEIYEVSRFEEKQHKQRSSDAASLADTLPWPDTVSTRSSFVNGAPQSRIVKTTVGNNRHGKESSLADTVPWPSNSSSSPSHPQSNTPNVAFDFLAFPDYKKQSNGQSTSNSDIFNWPFFSKGEISKIIHDAAQKKDMSSKRTSSLASTVPWPSDCDAPVFPNRKSSSPEAPSLSPPHHSVHETHRTTINSSVVVSDSLQGPTKISRISAVFSEVSISEEDTSPNQSPEQQVTTTEITKNISIIEISDDESSDTDQESPVRFFRTKPNRASYLDIVVSDTESESDKETQSLQKTVIPESDSDSSSFSTQDNNKKQTNRIDSCPVVISDTSEDDVCDVGDSQGTYYSEVTTGSPVGPDNGHLPEISEEDEDEEDDNRVAKKLDFDDKESEEEADTSIRTADRHTTRETTRSPRPSKSPLAAISKSPAAILSPVSPPLSRRHSVSSDESDNDKKLNKFFEQERRKREQQLRRHLDEDDSPQFIVPDDKVEDDFESSEEEEQGHSPSFYLRIINKRKESELDKSWLPGKTTKKPIATPTPTKVRPSSKTVGRATPKPRSFGIGGVIFSPVLSFIASLSASSHARCHPDAIPYLKKFKTTKHELAQRLYVLFNDHVFDSKLQADMSITWNNRLRSTAGFCYNQRKIHPNGEHIRTSRIELSAKILMDAGRLRDTLIHEMCHAATWVISGQLGGHGPIWKQWTVKARRKFPDLPAINRCHSYQIETKYIYKCRVCSYSFGRHTKSLDLERKVCGLCRGRFEVLVRGGSNTKPSPSKPPNVFALFVKENYKVVKAGRKSLKHGDVMKMLSQKFSEHKVSQQQSQY